MRGGIDILDRPSSSSAPGPGPREGGKAANRTPRVSIGLPVYNGGRFLPQAIDSILAQSFTDLELVISDNASTDDTEQTCRGYVARDSRVRYFRNEVNLGAAHNYNRVFHLARGEYFKWAAADDLCGPDMFAKCVSILDSNPDAVVCYAKTRIIDDEGAVLRDYDDQLHLRSVRPCDRFIQLLDALGECNAVFGLVRTEAMKHTRLIGNFIGSDCCLLAELSLHGQLVEIPEYLFLRREHPEASSCKPNVDEQLEFFDPRKRGSITLPDWRKIFENFRSVSVAPILRREKAFLFMHLLRRIVTARGHYMAELGAAFRDVLCSPHRRPVRKIKGCALPVRH